MTSNTTAKNILLVDDDQGFLDALSRSLTRRGYQVLAANNIQAARQQCEQMLPDYVVLDLKLDQESGLTLIPELRQRFPKVQMLMLTGYSSIATAVEAIKLGADNYLQKPASTREILAALVLHDTPPANTSTDSMAPPSLDRLEWEHIQRVLGENDGNISATARALGMHRRTLQRKLQKRPVKS